jgi:hypothetical protein
MFTLFFVYIYMKPLMKTVKCNFVHSSIVAVVAGYTWLLGSMFFQWVFGVVHGCTFMYVIIHVRMLC